MLLRVSGVIYIPEFPFHITIEIIASVQCEMPICLNIQTEAISPVDDPLFFLRTKGKSKCDVNRRVIRAKNMHASNGSE